MLWQSSTITLATVFVAPSFFAAVNADLGFPIRIGRICNDNWAWGDKSEDPMAYSCKQEGDRWCRGDAQGIIEAYKPDDQTKPDHWTIGDGWEDRPVLKWRGLGPNGDEKCPEGQRCHEGACIDGPLPSRGGWEW